MNLDGEGSGLRQSWPSRQSRLALTPNKGKNPAYSSWTEFPNPSSVGHNAGHTIGETTPQTNGGPGVSDQLGNPFVGMAVSYVINYGGSRSRSMLTSAQCAVGFLL